MVAPSAASAVKFLSAPPDAVRGFLFYGNDGQQISARAETLVKALSRKLGPDSEIIRLHDSDIAADPDRILGELATSSLFGGTKILWLTSFPAKAQTAVLEAISQPIAGAYLAIQAPDLKKSHKIVQAFEGSPGLAALASYGEDRDSLAATIRHYVSGAGYEIDSDAAALVATRCDFSELVAKSEAGKLMTFAGATRRITAKDVDACLIDQQTAGLSEIIDNALNGDGRKALLAFQRFMSEEQTVVPVLVVLSSTLVRLHSLRSAMDAGKPVMQAIKDLRPPVFFKQQDVLAAQVRRWPAAAISMPMEVLNTTLRDTRLKPLLAEALTEDLILTIARFARGLRPS